MARKINEDNERIKRRYLTYLREARRQDQASVDKATDAILRFERSTGFKAFKLFKTDQGVEMYSLMPNDEIDTFVATIMTELAQVDDLFRNPRSESRSIRKVFGDIDPTVKYVHDGATEPAETSARDRADELGVDHMYVFATANNQMFRVYEKDDLVWLDVSFLTEGSGGSTIYAAVFDYAHNNGKVFIGDPEGLSATALRRRTDNMLSSALKWGTTAHMAPHKAQLDGDIVLGVAPLRWKTGDVLGNLTSLIEVSVSNLIHDIPEVANARYDFASRTFRDGSDRRILVDGDGTSGQPGIQRSSSASSNRDAVGIGEGKPAPDGVSDAWNGRTRGGAPSAGRRTLKRGILLNTLAHAESGQRPGLLERSLRESRQLVRDGLQGTFYSRLQSSAKVSDLSDKSLGPADFRLLAEDVQAEIGKSIPGGRITGRLVRGLADAEGIPIQGRQRGAGIEVNPAAPDGVLGVARHEIIHALRDAGLWGKPYGLFSQSEWQGLVRAARADKALMADIATRYKDKPLTPAQLV